MTTVATRIAIAAIFFSFLGGLVSAFVPMIKPALSQSEKDWYLGLSINAGVVLFLALASNFAMREAARSWLGALVILGAFGLYFGEYMDTAHRVDPLAWGIIKTVSLGVLFYIYSAHNGFPNPLGEWRSRDGLSRTASVSVTPPGSLYDNSVTPPASLYNNTFDDAHELDDLADYGAVEAGEGRLKSA